MDVFSSLLDGNQDRKQSSFPAKRVESKEGGYSYRSFKYHLFCSFVVCCSIIVLIRMSHLGSLIISLAIYWASTATAILSIHLKPCLACFLTGAICSLLYSPIDVIRTVNQATEAGEQDLSVSISMGKLRIIKEIMELAATAYPMGLNAQITTEDSNSTDFDPEIGDIDLQSKIILLEVADQIKQVMSMSDSFKAPRLTVVIVGDRKDLATYVKKKVQACEEVGIKSSTFYLPADSTTEILLKLVDKLNHADAIDGILVQLPLPESIDEKLVICSIDYRKDVDGLHPYNMGRLAQSRNHVTAVPSTKESNSTGTAKVNSICTKDLQPQSERLLQKIKQFISPTCPDYFAPSTAESIVELLVHSQVPITGSQVTVVGRSFLVGLPLSLLLQKLEATVTMCHLNSRNLQFHCLNADILIVAIDCPNLITAGWVKKSAIVINAGTIDDSSSKNGYRLYGDLQLKNINHNNIHITLTPGGGGPLSISILMRNIGKSWIRRLIQRLSSTDDYSTNG